jgi:hypothetical protein
MTRNERDRLDLLLSLGLLFLAFYYAPQMIRFIEAGVEALLDAGEF